MIDLIATMIIRHECFGTIPTPFHRAIDLARSPTNDAEFWIEFATNTKTTAHIGRNDAHLIGRNIHDDFSKALLNTATALGRRIHGELTIFPFCHCAARLHWVRHNAIIDDINCDARFGLRHMNINLGFGTVFPMNADIAAMLFPNHRAVG